MASASKPSFEALLAAAQERPEAVSTGWVYPKDIEGRAFTVTDITGPVKGYRGKEKVRFAVTFSDDKTTGLLDLDVTPSRLKLLAMKGQFTGQKVTLAKADDKYGTWTFQSVK